MVNILFFLTFIPIFCYAITDPEFERLRQAQRQIDAHTVKSTVAHFNEEAAVEVHLNNADELQYLDKRGNFNKGLRHRSNGFPNVDAYNSLVRALTSTNPTDFNNILIGTGTFKLVDPQGSFMYSLSGNDGWIRTIPKAPAFTSLQAAGEMVELYWAALVRDVFFNTFDTNPIVASAIADLNHLSDFRGPKSGGSVTSETFLRGSTAGDLIGPYISQFLYSTIPYGSTTISPEQRVPLMSTINDFMTTFASWFTVINGGSTGSTITYDDTKHFLRTPRDLAEFVHSDSPAQVSVSTTLILNSFGKNALTPTHPYKNNPTQVGFVSFGLAEVLGRVMSAIEEALKATWYFKWQVDRRLRPEEFGFYVDTQVGGGSSLGINTNLLNSQALISTFATYGTYFLSQAYPEGSPVHPSYPAEHAAYIGAAVTILKAFYDETFVIPNPVQPDPTNTSLIAYNGPPLTIGNELNKLASNISIGREFAGVHYRSDAYEGMQLGEQIAIDVLRNASFLSNEAPSKFVFHKFNGERITIPTKTQGLALNDNPYTYRRGNAKEKQGDPATFLSWNVCMLFGAFSTPDSGVSPSSERLHAVANLLLSYDKDFICLQEVSPDAANGLYKALKHQYLHFYFTADPETLVSLDSGLFIASKVALTNVSVIQLPTDGVLNRSAITFKSKTLAITGTHLESGDNTANVEMRKKQIHTILQKIPLENSILLGDLNMDRDEYQSSDLPLYFYDNYNIKKYGYTTTNYFAAQVKDVPPTSYTVDYILTTIPSHFNVIRGTAFQIPSWAISDHHPLFTEI